MTDQQLPAKLLEVTQLVLERYKGIGQPAFKLIGEITAAWKAGVSIEALEQLALSSKHQSVGEFLGEIERLKFEQPARVV